MKLTVLNFALFALNAEYIVYTKKCTVLISQNKSKH